MCGLIYVRRKDGKSAVKSVKKRYHKQKYRGTEGYGYVAIKNDTIVSYERAPTEHEIMLKLEKEDAPEILFHHRFPTSTPNMEEQAHPLFIKNDMLKYDYYIAHNGVIRNADARKLVHEKLNIKYLTELRPLWQTITEKLYYATTIHSKFNDSEAIALDTAFALENKMSGIDSEGAAAVIALQVKDGKVVDRIFYRNNLNPLKYHEDRNMVTLTSLGAGSDIEAIYVMRFKGYLVDRHPSKLFTPTGYSYRSTTVAPKVYGVTPSYAEDDDVQYGTPYHLDNDWNFAAPPKLGVERPKPGLVSTETLKAMQEDILWEEYDKCLGTIKQVETGIEMLDKKVEEGIINASITRGRLSLQTSLDTLRAYKAQLAGEVSSRVARNKQSPLLTG